jgi:hypothetical protein
MFTLKLYQNQIGDRGRTVIIECAGVWADRFAINPGGSVVTQLHVFKKKVGIQDEDGGHDFYVGGTLPPPEERGPDFAIVDGAGGNHFAWGVLENAQGKTTEMFR